LLGLDLLGPGEQTAGRDADRDELAVVGAAVEAGAFGLHALLGERGHEVRLDLGGALRTRTGAFPVGVVAVVDEVAGVRRADHVEVQVERDVQLLFEGQALHVLGGADQAGLLGTPPREADRVLHVRGTAHAQGGFQQSGAPGAVVVDAGPFRDAVQVGTGHHDVVGAPGAGLGDDVAGGDALQPGLDVQLDLGTGLPGQLLPDLLGDAGGGDAGVLRVAEGAVERAVHVVVDDRRTGPQVGGHLLLLREGAGAALDQHHAAGDVHAVVVAGFAPRGVVHRGNGQRRGDAAFRGGRGVLERAALDRFAGHREAERVQVVGLVGEFRSGHVETGAAQLVRHVVHAGLVARPPGGPVALVLVGDALQRDQVPVDGVGADLVAEVRRSGQRWRGDAHGRGTGDRSGHRVPARLEGSTAHPYSPIRVDLCTR